MNKKNTLLIAFILIIIAQLFVPAKMIMDREDILLTGKEFIFQTSPIDPYDPFRGKYVQLSFNDTFVELEGAGDEWQRGQKIYVILGTDSNGFAKFESIERNPPEGSDFLETEVYYTSDTKNQELVRIHFELPFDRFYMEESKAADAEIAYNESRSDTTIVAWALVSIKNGEAVLKDVLIDGEPIGEILTEPDMQPNKVTTHP